MEDKKVKWNRRFTTINDVNNAVECRDICNETDGCYYWTFKVTFSVDLFGF